MNEILPKKKQLNNIELKYVCYIQYIYVICLSEHFVIKLYYFSSEKERLVSEETSQYKQQVASLTTQLDKTQADLVNTKVGHQSRFL